MLKSFGFLGAVFYSQKNIDRSADRLITVVHMRKRILLLATSAGLALSAIGSAAEERVWTSRKGADVTAQLLRVEGGVAVLITPQLKTVKLKIEDLSLVDRHYLVEYGGADPDVIAKSEVGVPEKDARDMTKTFVRVKERFGLGTDADLQYDMLRTEHFYVVTQGKIRPIATAEMAERLWRGMAFQHINFREDWGAKRKLIFLVEGEEAYQALGDWYKKHLQTQKGEHMVEVAQRTRVLWDQVSSTSMYMPDKIVEKLNIFERAKVFHVGDIKSSYGEVFGAFPTHSIADTLISDQFGGVADYAEEGYFAITTGHAYFKEIHLSGRTETSILDAEGYANDSIVKANGFDDGTKWAKTLRELVRKGKVEPDLEKMLSWNSPKNLTPERLVLMYSFAYYLQSTPERLNSFANMVRRVEYDGAMPVAIELAKFFGFKSADELEADWIKFLKSPDFK